MSELSARAVLEALDALVPLRLAESWDNTGLLLGDPEAVVRGILCTIDLTPAVAAEAEQRGCNVVIAYHPPLFRPQKTVTSGDLAYLALRAGLTVLCPHTALDAARGGTCEVMAERLGLVSTTPVHETEPELGPGRIGELPAQQSAAEFLEHVKRAFEVPAVLACGEERTIRRVAVCAGAGGGLLDRVLSLPAARAVDAYVVGELSHHDALLVERSGLLAVLLRHSVSERPALVSLAQRLAASLPVEVVVSERDREPLRFA